MHAIYKLLINVINCYFDTIFGQNLQPFTREIMANA